MNHINLNYIHDGLKKKGAWKMVSKFFVYSDEQVFKGQEGSDSRPTPTHQTLFLKKTLKIMFF